LKKTRAAWPFDSYNLLFPPTSLHLNKHVLTLGEANEVLSGLAIRTRRLPADNWKLRMVLQQVADRDFG